MLDLLSFAYTWAAFRNVRLIIVYYAGGPPQDYAERAHSGKPVAEKFAARRLKIDEPLTHLL